MARIVRPTRLRCGPTTQAITLSTVSVVPDGDWAGASGEAVGGEGGVAVDVDCGRSDVVSYRTMRTR